MAVPISTLFSIVTLVLSGLGLLVVIRNLRLASEIAGRSLASSSPTSRGSSSKHGLRAMKLGRATAEEVEGLTSRPPAGSACDEDAGIELATRPGSSCDSNVSSVPLSAWLQAKSNRSDGSAGSATPGSDSEDFSG
eukprot:TRINITY_DN13797_c0_g1_i1.p2 TRINITY_DN13797_c0_g1~~TRINITY_DN13797_c0_g1_i1.p2  ORF type:complete len:136 (-),score=19.03 TRINITY_DN13797_c0_g1_i1:153-560(-)